MRETIQNANGKQFHAVSLSGGKDSTAMLLLMIERDMPINMVLSADTGMEFPEMYEHLAKLDEHLFRERGIHITTLRHTLSYTTRIGKTTFIVNVKQSESAKKPLNTVFQELCRHEMLGDFSADKYLNLENLQKSS